MHPNVFNPIFPPNFTEGLHFSAFHYYCDKTVDTTMLFGADLLRFGCPERTSCVGRKDFFHFGGKYRE